MVGSFLGLLKLFNCKHFNCNHLKHGTLVLWFAGLDDWDQPLWSLFLLERALSGFQNHSASIKQPWPWLYVHNPISLMINIGKPPFNETQMNKPDSRTSAEYFTMGGIVIQGQLWHGMLGMLASPVQRIRNCTVTKYWTCAWPADFHHSQKHDWTFFQMNCHTWFRRLWQWVFPATFLYGSCMLNQIINMHRKWAWADPG